MRVIRHLAHIAPDARPRVVAAGGFDGVHRGHQQVLGRVVERARALQGEAVAVVASSLPLPRLTDRRDQLERLRAAGLDAVLFAPADQRAAALLRLGAVLEVTARSQPALPSAMPRESVDPVRHEGAVISAGRIGAALGRGDLDGAAAMLGRRPGVAGRVVHGFHRGRPLGIPTANLRVRGIQLPPDGVYAVRARVADRELHGVANIGFNPTFGNQTRSVETHLLDFDGDLYGSRLALSFVLRLRGERKFPDVAALLSQIRADIAAARACFQRDERGD